jgi:TetR/AcrR family transcriptional regulator, transcriptional repressor for nem operon
MAMGRPRTFQDDEIRAAMMQLFWQHGFEGTALPDLEMATGLSRKSLYNAFGDKQAMFVAALGAFRQAVVREHTLALAQDGAGVKSISTVLHGLADLAGTPTGRMGCMICNTSREDVADVPAVREEINAYFAAIEAAMLKAILTGQALGEIEDRKPEDLARLCLGAIVSISVLAKAGQPVAVLKSIASETIAALR